MRPKQNINEKELTTKTGNPIRVLDGRQFAETQQSAVKNCCNITKIRVTIILKIYKMYAEVG